MATQAYQFVPQLSQSTLAAGERCEKHAADGSIVSRVRNGAPDKYPTTVAIEKRTWWSAVESLVDAVDSSSTGTCRDVGAVKLAPIPVRILAVRG